MSLEVVRGRLLVEADMRGRALYLTYLAFDDYVTRISFRDFLGRGVKVRRAPGGES